MYLNYDDLEDIRREYYGDEDYYDEDGDGDDFDEYNDLDIDE